MAKFWSFVLIVLLGASELRADDSDPTNEVIGIIDNCLDIGGYALDALQPLGTIAKVGSIVFGLSHRKDEQVMKKLNDLDRKLDLLGQEMVQKFNELEAFMIETIFYTQMAETASMLRRFMQDAIRNPSEASFRMFHTEYMRNPPMEYIYRLLGMLDQPTTNPLKMAMNADPLRTNATFQKWRTIIDGVSSEFLFIETFANGMLWNETMYEPVTMKGRLVNLQSQVEGWKHTYMNSYWPDVVQKVLDDLKNQNPLPDYVERANIVSKALNQILTEDSFIILSHNPCKSDQYGSDCRDRLIEDLGKDNFVWVYRSVQWKNTTIDEQNAFTQNVRQFENSKFSCSTNLDSESSYLSGQIRNTGFVALFSYDCSFCFQFVNNDYRKPNHPVHAFTQWDNCKHQQTFYSVVGYN